MKREDTSSQTDATRPAVSDDNDAGRVVVLGLGNILLSDEGVGVHAVNGLTRRYAFTPPVEAVDGGTMGLDLLPLFQSRDRIIIIDAVDFGKDPGHIGIIEGDKIPSVLNPKLSAHHIGLSDILFATKLVRDTQPEVCLIGIQPKSLDIGLDMTPEIQVQLNALIDLVLQKLREWNIECVLQSPQESSP